MSENETFNDEYVNGAQDTPEDVKEPAAEETPVAEAPAEETPVEETPVEETPAEEAPVEEAPAEEAAEAAVEAEAPAEEAPAETPAEEVVENTVQQPAAESIQTEPNSGSYTAPKQETNQAPGDAKKPAAKKKSKKGIVIAIVAIVLVLCLLCMLCGIGVIVLATKKTKVKLDDYVTVVYDGADGYGTATYFFDEAAFIEKYDSKISFKQSHDLYGYYTAWYGDNAAEAFIDVCVDCSVIPSSGLSNGDTVTVTLECDEELAKSLFGSKVVYSETLEFTVEGLAELEAVDPFEGIELTFSGYDSKGTVSLSKDNVRSEFYYFDYAIDVRENLSNGDTITVSIADSWENNSGYIADTYGITVSATEKTYTVEGLEAVTEIDPFEDLVLTYSGYEPYGYLSVSTNSSNRFVQGLYFNADKTDYLSNGDEITVTVSSWSDDLEGYALENGYKLTQTSKTYTVEGVYTYYTDAAQLPSDMVEQMNKEGIDFWTAKTASTYDSADVQSIQYKGNIILTRKGEYSSWSTNTYLYMIYEIKAKVDYSGYDKNGKEKVCNDVVTAYVYVRFKNAAEIDGEWSVDVNDYDTCTGERFKYDTGVYNSSKIYSWSDTTELYFYSYEEYADLYNDVVTVNLADYTYSTTLDSNGEPLEADDTEE